MVHMGEKKYTFSVLVEKLVRKNHFEDLGVMGGRMMCKMGARVIGWQDMN